MKYKFVAYEALKAEIFTSIGTFLKRNGYAQKKIDELFKIYAQNTQSSEILASNYEKISLRRRKQIGFLLCTIRCLDASFKVEDDKAYLLHATAFYVRECIDDSYNPDKSWVNYMASFATTVDESKLYTLLGFSLKLSPRHKPSYEEYICMYNKLKDFICEYVYIDPNDLNKGYLGVDKQVFSHPKIERFNPENFLKQLIERIAALGKQAVDEAEEKYKKNNSQELKKTRRCKSNRMFPVASSYALEEEQAIQMLREIEYECS